MSKNKEKFNIISDLLPLKTSISDCKLDPKNAREGHDIKSIAESLNKYGQRKPIVVNKKTGNIEAGNGTFKAAIDAGWSHIAAVFVEDDDETAIGYSIADNRTGDLSEFNIDTLADLFMNIDALDIPGVDEQWLDEIESSINDDEEDTPEDKPLDAEVFEIVVICKDEKQQIKLLNEFEEKGIECRAICC